MRNGSAHHGAYLRDRHDRAGAYERSNIALAHTKVGDVMFHFVFDTTERGMIGKRSLVWEPMKSVTFDHTAPPYGEDARRFIENQRGGIGSKRTNAESNLLLFTGRELPIRRAQRKLATARPQEVLAELDVTPANEIDPRPSVEHELPNPACSKTVVRLDLRGCSPDRARWYVNETFRPPGPFLQRLRGQGWYEPPFTHDGCDGRRRTPLHVFPFIKRLRNLRWYKPPVGNNDGSMRRYTRLILFPYLVGSDRLGIVATVVAIGISLVRDDVLWHQMHRGISTLISYKRKVLGRYRPFIVIRSRAGMTDEIPHVPK
jgi:hypothetical protein